MPANGGARLAAANRRVALEMARILLSTVLFITGCAAGALAWSFAYGTPADFEIFLVLSFLVLASSIVVTYVISHGNSCINIIRGVGLGLCQLGLGETVFYRTHAWPGWPTRPDLHFDMGLTGLLALWELLLGTLIIVFSVVPWHRIPKRGK